MDNILKISWIAGIFNLALTIPEVVMFVIREDSQLDPSFHNIFIIISLLSMATIVFFLAGFMVISNKLNNSLLFIATLLLITFEIIESGYDIFALYQNYIPDEEIIRGTFSVVFGFAGIAFGIGLLRLRTEFGFTALAAGTLNIITGFTFAIIVLFFIGFILLIPTMIVEIYLLYKAARKFALNQS